MAGEITVPILPCRDLDESIWFYEALGFVLTYRQVKPNPYAVVQREDLLLHLFSIDGFDPEKSYGSVIVLVPDPDTIHAEFAAGLRAAFGKLPSSGIPRILRPRKKQGTVFGFSIVDPGGNWLRFFRSGDTEDESPEDKTTGLARVIANAVRQGDARGDHAEAQRLLLAGLNRYPDAPASEQAQALLYRVELAVRAGDQPDAAECLARAEALELTAEERTELAADFDHAREVLAACPSPPSD